MSKPKTPNPPGNHGYQAKSGVDALGLATLAGVVGLLMISFSNLRAIDGIKDEIDEIEDKVTQAAKVQVQAQAAPATPPAKPRGPDPEKAYEIKLAGSPTKGPANAPVTIAEFSDFQ